MPEAPATGDQTGEQYDDQSSDPLEVHGQRRHNGANPKRYKDSRCGQHNRIVPPAPLFLSSAKLIASLPHHRLLAIQSIAGALTQDSFVGGAMLFGRSDRGA